MNKVRIYCPKCGEWLEINRHIDISPGDTIIDCPMCSTVWNVIIQFEDTERQY